MVYLNEHGHFPPPWRDEVQKSVNPNNWPLQSEKELNKFYGEIGKNQTFIQLPYKQKLSWNNRQTISRFSCHEKVHDSLVRIFDRVLSHYGEEEIEVLRLDQFGGCLNVRKMRGGSAWSTHSWGIAVDYDPTHNKLRWGRDRASFAKPAYDEWWKIWEDEGWVGLGREKNYDWMHIQAAKVK